MTARQLLIKALKEIGREDASAMLPVDKTMLNRLDCKPSYPEIHELLFSFNWGLTGNCSYWLTVYEQLSGLDMSEIRKS